VDFLAVPLDDFEVILRNKYLNMAKVLVMPYLGGILIGDKKFPHCVKAIPLSNCELSMV